MTDKLKMMNGEPVWDGKQAGSIYLYITENDKNKQEALLC